MIPDKIVEIWYYMSYRFICGGGTEEAETSRVFFVVAIVSPAVNTSEHCPFWTELHSNSQVTVHTTDNFSALHLLRVSSKF